MARRIAAVDHLAFTLACIYASRKPTTSSPRSTTTAFGVLRLHRSRRTGQAVAALPVAHRPMCITARLSADQRREPARRRTSNKHDALVAHQTAVEVVEEPFAPVD
jgi:hypothetical protein